MPGYDQTGPNGEGPLTGGGLGYCRGGFARGRGFRRGDDWGIGRRFRFRKFAPKEITEKEEKEILKEELKTMEEDKKEVEKRLKELR